MNLSKLKPLANWIKLHTQNLYIIGGVLWVLGIVTALFWVAGKDVESLSFLLVTFASVFFASPLIARYISPEPKLVRDMNLGEILRHMMTVDATSDWQHVHSDLAHEAFYRTDPALRITRRYDESGVQNDNFQEPWANDHPDERAFGHYYDLSYRGELIRRFVLVSVDGARAYLPIPKSRKKLLVDPLAYKIAQIFDSLDTLDEYMESSGLIVANGNI